MANKEIPELDAADTLDGSEVVHVVQGGNSRKTTTGGVATVVLIDEDSFASDSATKAPSQQSVKAYVGQRSAEQWTSYTPTFTGLGTVTSPSIFTRRVGDSLHVFGTFVCGTPTDTEARMTFGTGLVSDATKVPSIRMCGTVARGFAVANSYFTLIETSVGYVTFSVASVAGQPLAKANGNDVFTAGNVISVNFVVPISGW